MLTPLLLRGNWRVECGAVEPGASKSNIVNINFGAATNFNRYRRERTSAVALVLVLHGAVIALVMFSRTVVRENARPGLIAFDVAANAAREAQTQLPHPHHPRVAIPAAQMPAPMLDITPVDAMQILPDALPISDTPAQEVPAAIGGGCDLTPQVQDALRHSDEIVSRLPAIPADRRSIANAIVVWNAGWIDPGIGPAQAVLATIRQAIEASVAASSADCRNQIQAGPRLIYLADNTGKTTVLALGSGQWSWQQLSASGLPQSADTTQVAMTPRPAAPLAARGPSTGASAQTPALNALLASLIGKRSLAGTPYYP